MKQFPRALSHWAEPLSALPEHVASAVAGWLGPIETAFGVPDSGQYDAEGDPDGYDGLCRRGPFHRLLASEWLLAGEIPDEFLRRAAMMEQPFFQLARRSTRARGRCLVLLESGPRQLGAPRLVQFAVLVVLARRAALSNAELAWAPMAASAEATVYADLSADAIQHFVQSRCARNPSASDVEASLAQLKVTAEDELWFVGSEALLDMPGRRVTIAEGTGPGGDPIQMSIRDPRKQSVSRVELTLPQPAVAVRVLRDPTEQAAASGTSAPLADDPSGIALCSGRLTLRMADGGVRIYPVPNSPNAAPGRFRKLMVAPGDRVLAATRVQSRLLALVLRGEELRAIGVGDESLGNSYQGSTCELPEEPSERIRGRTSEAFGVLRKIFNGVAYIDPSGVYLRLLRGTDMTHVAWNFDTLDVTSDSSKVHRVEHSRADRAVCWLSPTGSALKVQYERAQMPRVFTGFGTQQHEPTRAVQVGPRTFAMIRPTTPGVMLTSPPGEEVVGACRDGLLTLSEDRTRLSLQTLNVSKSLAVWTEPIATVAVDDYNSFIACRSFLGRVRVYRYGMESPVLDLWKQDEP